MAGTDLAHAALMDRIYRLQRPIYDITRKYYLFGRDRLLRRVDFRDGETVLEVGCGTARNLIAACRRRPKARYFGLDASNEMLAEARAKIAARGLSDKIRVEWAYAEQFTAAGTFGLDGGIDTMLFSYSLTMIPDPVGALENALNQVRPGGRIAVVDFHHFGRWPKVLRRLFHGWLGTFHVKVRPEVLDTFARWAHEGKGRLDLQELGGGYCYIAVFTKGHERRA